MYSNLVSQAMLGLGFIGYVAATNPGCAHPCIQLHPNHQEPWFCPVGIPRPHYHSGKWPTPEEENLAKALIGPVTKQQPCGWQADGKLCRASQNAHVSLSLVSSKPLTVKVKVNNHDSYPITFWTKYSPLSQYAFDYGYFKITAQGDHSVTLAPPPEGYRPEAASELSVILPGEALEADIVLTDPNHVFHQMVKSGGDIEISMSGQWNGLWATTAPEVMRSDLVHCCNNIWNTLNITWSSLNKLLLRFPKEHHVSAVPQHSEPRYGAKPRASAANEPTYGDDSSGVSSDVGHETEETSSADQSDSTPKDEAESGESYASEQPTKESPEYTSPENEADYSSTESPAAESPAYGSASASQSGANKVAATPAPFFAKSGRAEEEPKATAATRSWTTMPSTTTQPVYKLGARSLVACDKDCKCKDH
ncbi:uncharacterized protein FSUBG_9540 [Fusarium subglutinans]|uniref:Uncharacterized protein n=1 Tax=Gibberella subglutinans TaxID=42677 RepID=A0A8H5PCL4_GIBSU|nr:uncharacterized protein FSUBG_9540 [Fusarium subglutinans]KAF5594118.1 hypothetical protein FSUBG_9540 [Fusarium subglutinans]